MRYIGNKTKLLPFIESSFERYYSDTSGLVLCDLFAGTCSVSSYFKTKFRHVISNDLEDYSLALAKNYISNDGPPEGYEKLIEHMNSLSPKSGKLSRNFSPDGSNRKFFTTHNAQKIQAMREEVERLSDNDAVYNFLLCSLLESADACSNTTGVYGAYLKKFNSRSEQDIVLKPYISKHGSGTALQGDAVEVVKGLSGDILYLDPPYNTRKYSSNYHVLNCIVNHESFEIKQVQATVESVDENTGVAHKERISKESVSGLTTDMNNSAFSSKTTVQKALEELIENSSGFETVFLSYNDEGILKIEDVENIFRRHGEYELLEKQHKRYKSNTKSDEKQNKEVRELLHVLRRTE